MMSKGEGQVVAEVGPGNHMGSLFFRRSLLKGSRKHGEKIRHTSPVFDNIKKPDRDQNSMGLQSWSRK